MFLFVDAAGDEVRNLHLAMREGVAQALRLDLWGIDLGTFAFQTNAHRARVGVVGVVPATSTAILRHARRDPRRSVRIEKHHTTPYNGSMARFNGTRQLPPPPASTGSAGIPNQPVIHTVKP